MSSVPSDPTEHMPGLVEFLRARFNEEEEAARRLLSQTELPTPVAVTVGFLSREYLFDDRPAGMLVIQNPERELRDVDAKRQIIAKYERLSKRAGSADETVIDHARRTTLEEVIKGLALKYSDHHDYLQGWKP